MNFDVIDFDWDEDNEPKLWERHQVSADEAEEVFFNPNVVRSARKLGRTHSREERYYLFGRTDAGRPLFLVFLFGGPVGPTTRVRVFSARTLERHEIAWLESQFP